MTSQHAKLIELIELQLENRITRDQFRLLEQLIRDDIDARRVYREYMDLHGVLHWDTARVGDQPFSPPRPARPPRRPGMEKLVVSVVTVAAICVVVGLAVVFNNPGNEDIAGTTVDDSPTLVDNDTQPDDTPQPIPDGPGPTPVPLPPHRDTPEVPETLHTVNDDGTPAINDVHRSNRIPQPAGDLPSVVAFINAHIKRTWAENEVEPSPRAADAEWFRRAHLDIIGHIPEPKQTEAFLAVDDRSNGDRAYVIDTLLEDEDYIRNWSSIWTNLLIGRSNPRDVDRPALQKYLRDAFAHNRPWNDVVGEFISASGKAEENGAANFLLAHVNNEAVPATAITARLFLGLQIQCTQCHDHPFNDLKQNHFWAFNSFFQQVDVENASLVDEEGFDLTFYENRQGLTMATFPAWEDTRFDPEKNPEVNLRSELASLLTSGDKPQIARAFVNRVWKHFTGESFTPTVDEMGPHVAVSHPDLLDGLSREFVRSGYNVKHLIRAICRSDVYNLSSQSTEDNADLDAPELGLDPLFTRAYVKQMTAEQLFDSLLIATQANAVFGSDWTAASQRRDRWQKQFVMAFNTDENDEADLFNGTIPQALMMMNSDLIRRAVTDRNGYLAAVLRRRDTGESAKIQAISLAALSRRPSKSELTAVRGMISENVSARPRGVDAVTARQNSMQDLFWAYLNSNEFILIH